MVKTVILCNRLSRLQSILRSKPGPLKYLNLVATHESLRISNFLCERPDADELPRSRLLRQRRHDFRDKYIRFMGELNGANHSLLWWAMGFTNKNPLLTPLCRDTSYLLLIVELVRTSRETLVVVTDNKYLGEEVDSWGRSEGVDTINAVSERWSWKSAIKTYTPLAIFYAALLTFWISYRVRPFRLAKNIQGSHTVVTSPLHVRSFAEPGKYRDVYFGKLVEGLEVDGGKPLVFGLFHDGWRQQLSKLKTLRPSFPIVPIEAYLTLQDLLRCGSMALRACYMPAPVLGTVEIDSVDVRGLVNRAIREASRSGSLFMDLRMYYCAGRLAQTIDVARCIYPYENRPWEKMLIRGIKAGSPATRLVGYQHSALTLSHINFYLEEEEAKVVPLPDVILTTGAVINEWLEQGGNYPKGLLKTSCALRQGQTFPAKEGRSKQTQTRVLVALGTSLEEDVSTLVFLDKAFVHAKGYDLRIRPYPTRPLQPAMEIAPLAGGDFFSTSTGSLADDFKWADVVLYSSTTVGLEAVSTGIPAVRLDLGDFLDTDPMFTWSEFKWSVGEPEKLVETIDDIMAMPSDEFLERQRKGREYIADYLTPVTAGGLRPFWEA